jgi:tRNA dimethylallyltransferase
VIEREARVLVIAGPTASGKSATALRKAQEREGKGGAVIINADSLQLYDGLPILTAQPSAEDKELVPHRLYGLLSPQESCDAVKWRGFALVEIREALARGALPIVTGGTGFYLKALIEGFSPIPEIPDDVRLLGEELMDRVGVDVFFEVLREEDPETASRLDPKNRQRLIRAWEVQTHTGKSLSYWQSLPKEPVAPDLYFDIHLVLPEREVLYERCNRRFVEMIEQGGLEEVQNFDKEIELGNIPAGAALTHALGVQPLRDYLHGEVGLDTAIFLAQNETRHYAKRQVTWFRHQMV